MEMRKLGNKIPRTFKPGLLQLVSWLKRKLQWDAEREQFPDDAQANELLTKVYRKPWGLL